MENFYRLPISKEYETRGCKVNIDAYSDELRVDITVKNLTTGYGSSYVHELTSDRNDKGYTDEDMRTIKNELNNLLDNYGDPECNEIHFTNQILS